MVILSSLSNRAPISYLPPGSIQWVNPNKFSARPTQPPSIQIVFGSPSCTTRCYPRPYFRADSVTWNPHKLLGTLLQCSTLHLKENVSRQTFNWISRILMNFKINYKKHTLECLIKCISQFFLKFLKFNQETKIRKR